jgi:hypothetical protein
MSFSATINLTSAGTDAALFDIYSDVDGYIVPFASSVPKSTMLSGYLATNVPDGTTACRVTANCGTSVDMPLDDPYIYVYTRCDTGDPYYNPGITTLARVEDNNTPTPNCYQYADQGFLSDMTVAYPSLTLNPTLVNSTCECV